MVDVAWAAGPGSDIESLGSCQKSRMQITILKSFLNCYPLHERLFMVRKLE